MDWYVIGSSGLTLWALLRLPSRMSRIDNIGGSLVLALALGTVLWPFAVAAIIKQRK